MKLSQKENLKIDILMLAIFPAVAVFFSLFLKLPFLFSTLLFYGLPSLYFSIRTKNLILRTLVFSLLLSVPGGIVGDFLAAKDGSWFVPTIFPFRILGVISIEDLVWFFLIIYTIIITYEHFIDRGKHKIANFHIKNFILFIFALFIIFLIFISQSQSARVPYFYAWVGVIFIIPVELILLKFPRLLFRILRIVPYFIGLFLLNEIVGLQLGHWSFPGPDFLGWVNFFGVSFPYEELIIFIILWSTIVLTFFEYFDDDRRELR